MNDAKSEMEAAAGERSAIVELRRLSRAGMIAVIYRGGRRRKAIPLTDGIVVEVPEPDQRCEAPQHLEACIGITAGGLPATVHHLNLGLVVDYGTFGGVYVLPSGEVAAIYGAEAIPLGSHNLE
ncbi:hypothetical protein [Singulisphaera acidiphila]|uniref:Uncharacterized protein n=1 Tax=Singulisphaera acidiphila (strain ATCC BAA-1392 / DSM 18658 / VKM B-2454 / MOB10) TaxID=886293 RepID=L0DNE4_SINAD|nr:hypothetical protein [Singulisphaera acidiphila]AGA30782.1 hypothetical protein Sinac_6712 [Singulisphaera acidiphila DSM 18658]